MPEELNFQKVMEIGAQAVGGSFGGAVGGALAGAFVREVFGGQERTEALITNAIKEICERLIKVIDNSFMQEYIADTNSIASRLLAYQETNDLSILDEIFADASDTVQHLRRFDTIESITSCNYISSLHMVTIKALAEYNSGYNETLKRVGKEYAEWSRSTVQRIIDLTNASIEKPFPIFVEALITPNLAQSYSVKLSTDNMCQLQLLTTYRDYWSSNSLKPLMSEYITIFKRVCTESDNKRHLDMSVKDDYNFLQEIRKFNEESEQIVTDILNQRLDVANAMKESILRACDTWDSL